MREPERKCTICSALVDEEDLFCSNCGAEVPRIESDDSPKLAQRETTHNFICQSCGASMSYDASAQALRCPFCGSQRMEKQQDGRTIQPAEVVPFVVQREQAEQITRTWLGVGWLRPADLSDAAVITKMSAVYVPYWVFRAFSFTYWTADTSVTPAGASGDWFPLSGEHRGRHSGILIGASGALTPQETQFLRPFNLNLAQPPSEIDLENVIVEQFSVPRKYARPLARCDVELRERQVVDEKYVPGRSRHVKVNTILSALSSRPLLLPVWTMAYQYRNKSFRLLLNGQTGKLHGRKPISYRKILTIVGIAIATIVALLLLVSLLTGVSSMTGSSR